MSRSIQVFRILGFVLLVVGMAACESLPTFDQISGGQSKTSPTVSPALFLRTTHQELTLPAGSSTQFYLELVYAPEAMPHSVIWEMQNIPQGIAAELQSMVVPWEHRLLVSANAALAPGRYPITVSATANQPISLTLTVNVTPCAETQSGEFTLNIQSNLVDLITAGKPADEHGLLVPIQICDRSRHLRVSLKEVVSAAGTVMTEAPPFYLYRSLVWPAPSSIQAHYYWSTNVEVPRVNSTGWQLDGEVEPGLYLLIFERDHYPPSSDPETLPAAVTYQLELEPRQQ